MELSQSDTLLELQHRPNELGRIRLGAKATTKGGKEYPTTLAEWRLTSGSKALLDAAAALYGGTVEVWEDAPDEGFYQLLTESRELRVLIPTALRTVSQSYELWQGGTCMRRCDGKVEQISGEACVCNALDLTGSDRCDVMTRVSLMLPDVPGLGVWRLDTSGWHAATSLPATIELLKQLSTQPWIPAILRLEQRSKKVREDGKVVTHRFAVPVLDLPGLTVGKVVARMANAETPRIEAVARPPQPTAAERVAQRAAAITSGPLAQPVATTAAVEAPSVSVPRDEPGSEVDQGSLVETSAGRPEPEEEGDFVTPSEEPPPPAAGALDATPVVPGSAIEGNLTPAQRCEAFSTEFGACQRDAGHVGLHQA